MSITSIPQDQLSRRKLLQAMLAASVPASTLTGCVSNAGASEPELVWGRRGQSEGRFLKPRAVTIDRMDRLYIVDTTGRIQVFDADGNWIRQWKTPQTKNGRPTGMAIDRGESPEQDRLLVADTHYYRMLVFTLEGERLEEAEIGGTSGRKPGEFAFVTDAVSDSEGNYYVGEYGDSDRIQKFDPEGQFVLEWGGTGREPERFVRPQSLVVYDHVLWVCDACNHRIQAFDLRDSPPRLIDIWGTPGSNPGQFHYPYDMVVLPGGDELLICEYGNQRIQRLTATGEPMAIWGSPGFEPGQLYQPWGLVIDSKERVHILDSNNHRVQRVRIPNTLPT